MTHTTNIASFNYTTFNNVCCGLKKTILKGKLFNNSSSYKINYCSGHRKQFIFRFKQIGIISSCYPRVRTIKFPSFWNSLKIVIMSFSRFKLPISVLMKRVLFCWIETQPSSLMIWIQNTKQRSAKYYLIIGCTF